MPLQTMRGVMMRNKEMRVTDWLLLYFALFLVVTCVPGLLHGQRITNSIVGIVTDESGGVVPEADVTATNRLTGVRYTTVKTDSVGYYVITELPQGEYAVQVVKSGFKTFTRAGIGVSVNETARIDVKLSVGSTSQRIDVIGGSPLVDSESALEKTEIGHSEITELPSSVSGGRSVLDFTQLAPGLTSNNGQQYGNNNYSINGSPENTQTAMVDGANLVGPGTGQWYALRPMVEEVASVNVQTASYKAEYGGMGAFNMTTLSGTNRFHGAGNFFYSPQAWESRNFFSAATAPAHSREWGFNFGGPIIKNKLFFSVTYDRWTFLHSYPVISTVPTAQMDLGNLSAVPTTIYDPMTTCGQYGNPACAVNAQGQPIITRQPFQNNTIPTARLDPVAQKLIQYFPAPNLPGVSNNYTNAANSSGTGTGVAPYFDAKVDFNLNEKNRLFGRVEWTAPYQNGNANFPGPAANGFAQTDANDEWSIIIGDTHTFNSHWVNEFRANYLYGSTKAIGTWGLNKDIDAAVGLSHLSGRDFPQVSIGGLLNMVMGGCCFGRLSNPAEGYTITDDVSYVRGRNIIKFGGGITWERDNAANFNNPSGAFGFSGIFTTNLQGTSPGLGFADLLLGLANNVTVSPVGPTFGFRSQHANWFIQDDIKLAPKLTLNIGLRYELYMGDKEAFNRTSNFDPTAINPATTTPGAVVYAGMNGTPTRFSQPRNDFAPRVGLAYSPDSKTAIRAGAGLFYAETSWKA
jgi:hypothetical protein